MVIGSHPHVVQPIRMERVAMPNGSAKEALVVYSLGNFISNQQQPNTDGGIMYQVDLLKRKGSPEVVLGQQGMIPVWRYIDKAASGKTTFYAVPIARAEGNPDLIPGMASSAQNAMTTFARNLRKRVPYKELKR